VLFDDLGVPVRFTHHGTGNDKDNFGRHVKTLRIDPPSELGGKIIFLHRHPADVAVSYYYECTKRNSFTTKRKVKNFIEGRRAPNNIDKFVLSHRFGVPKIVHFNLQIAALTHDLPRVIFVSYEELQNNTQQYVKKILNFLGEDRSNIDIEEAVASASFGVMQASEREGSYSDRYGRVLSPRDQRDIATYKVRRGKVKGYIDELRPETIRKIHEMLDEAECFERISQLHKLNTAMHGYEGSESPCPPA